MRAEPQVSREYEMLKARKFRDYSLGHRLMYQTPLTLMRRSPKHPEKFSILEAGFGIGWGLDRMVEAGVVGRYVGCEPDADSFAYVKERHTDTDGVTLINAPFCPQITNDTFDHVFCIEVIEHVPHDDHLEFLEGLRERTGGTLWFSTPGTEKSDHGVRPSDEWRLLLRGAGFQDVTMHTQQWTTLFICQ